MKSEFLLKNYSFNLEKGYIAQEPPKNREDSKLMVYFKEKDKIEHFKFKDIKYLLDKNWILVLNNSKVQPAKVIAKKDTGGILNLIISSFDDGYIKFLLSPSKKLKEKQLIILPGNIFVKVVSKDDVTGEFIAEGNFSKNDINNIIKKYGLAPLPPYIKRDLCDNRNELDLKRYQTVYAKDGYSIAAPTAGLHFTKNILDELVEKGVKIAYIKLNVGLATFKLLKNENILEHKMLPEFACVSKSSADLINDGIFANKKILAVGTTVVRTLEYLASKNNGRIKKYDGYVDIYIYPGYEFKIVSSMLTNFHLPKSSNFILVSALIGRSKALEIYEIAKKYNYKFYSYGDALLIL